MVREGHGERGSRSDGTPGESSPDDYQTQQSAGRALRQARMAVMSAPLICGPGRSVYCPDKRSGIRCGVALGLIAGHVLFAAGVLCVEIRPTASWGAGKGQK